MITANRLHKFVSSFPSSVCAVCSKELENKNYHVESSSVECPVCHKPSGDYENPEGCWHNVNSKGEIENIDEEPKEVESGKGLPPIPEPSTNYVNVAKWELGWRREQLRASLLREEGLADQIAYLEQHNQFLAANLNLFKKEVERLKELLKSAVTIARDAYQAWNYNQDMKCGKILLALTGSNRGYRADTDAIQAAVTGE